MNTETNDLIKLEEGEKAPEGFEPVPEELERAAGLKLAGKDSAHVSFNSGGKLSSWAAGQRKKKKRKMAKASRKINRKKK